MKTYQGDRRAGIGRRVTVDGQPLAPRHDLRNHSPTGFEWGYAGSGPSQLSLAILADCLGDPWLALCHYIDFKFDVVAGWSCDRWTITEDEVRAYLATRPAPTEDDLYLAGKPFPEDD